MLVRLTNARRPKKPKKPRARKSFFNIHLFSERNASAAASGAGTLCAAAHPPFLQVDPANYSTRCAPAQIQAQLGMFEDVVDNNPIIYGSRQRLFETTGIGKRNSSQPCQ